MKIHEDLLKLPSLQCIGGSSVPPQMSCQTLGQVMRRRAHRLALAEACMHFSVLFLVCSVWENALHGCNSGGNVV